MKTKKCMSLVGSVKEFRNQRPRKPRNHRCFKEYEKLLIFTKKLVYHRITEKTIGLNEHKSEKFGISDLKIIF